MQLAFLNDSKNRIILGGLVFLSVLTFLNVLAVKQQTGSSTFAKLNPSSILTLNPQIVNTFKDQEFKIEIILDPAGQKVDAVDAILTFDPAAIDVVSVTPSNLFSAFPVKNFGNGRIQLSAIGVSPETAPKPVTQKGVYGTLTLKAKKATSSIISFSKDSIIASLGQDVLLRTQGATLNVR